MSFRQYGGINYAAKNNIVKNNFTNANNLSIMNKVGQPDSLINVESTLDVYAINLTSPTITTNENGVVPKSYVDAFVSGLKPKLNCQLATTAALSGDQNPEVGTYTGLQIDSVTVSSGDRVLIKNQPGTSSNPYLGSVYNGIYDYIISSGTTGTFQRSYDYVVTDDAYGAYVLVLEGTTNGGKSFIEINEGDVGTAELLFTQFTASFGLGQGLEKVTQGSATIVQMRSDLSTTSSTNVNPFISKLTVQGTGQGATPLRLIEASSQTNILFNPNSNPGNFNGIVLPGDSAITVTSSAIDISTLTLTTWSNTMSGLRLTADSAMLGAGGTTGTIPTSNIMFSGVSAALTGSLTISAGLTVSTTLTVNGSCTLNTAIVSNGLTVSTGTTNLGVTNINNTLVATPSAVTWLNGSSTFISTNTTGTVAAMRLVATATQTFIQAGLPSTSGSAADIIFSNMYYAGASWATINQAGLTVNGTIKTTGASGIINNVYYQLQDNATASITTGQIYANTTDFIYDNNASGGSHTFAVNADPNQVIPLQFSSADFTIKTTNSPTSQYVLTDYADSTQKLATTKWVQSAITAGGGGGTSNWTLNGVNLYPNTFNTTNVLVGTSTNANNQRLYVVGETTLQGSASVGNVGGAGTFTCYSPAIFAEGLEVGNQLTLIGQGLQVNNGTILNAGTTINEGLTVSNSGSSIPTANLQGGLKVTGGTTSLASLTINGGTNSIIGGTTTFDSTTIVNLQGTNNISGFAKLNSPSFSGTPLAPTAPLNTNTLQIATTAYVSNYAPLASPNFTGVPTAPTASATSNNTQIATTAFVVNYGPGSVLYKSNWFVVSVQQTITFTLTQLVGFADKMPFIQVLYRPTTSLNYIYDITGQQSNSGYDQSFLVFYNFLDSSFPVLSIRTGDNNVALTMDPITPTTQVSRITGEYQVILRR